MIHTESNTVHLSVRPILRRVPSQSLAARCRRRPEGLSSAKRSPNSTFTPSSRSGCGVERSERGVAGGRCWRRDLSVGSFWGHTDVRSAQGTRFTNKFMGIIWTEYGYSFWAVIPANFTHDAASSPTALSSMFRSSPVWSRLSCVGSTGKVVKARSNWTPGANSSFNETFWCVVDSRPRRGKHGASATLQRKHAFCRN